MVETLSDNRNRTGAEVRNLFSKNGGSMAEPGAVSWQFERKGVLTVPQSFDEDTVMEVAMEAGAEDLSSNGEAWVEIEHASERPTHERHDRIVSEKPQGQRPRHAEQPAEILHREREPHAEHHNAQRPRDQWPGEPGKCARTPKRQRRAKHQPHGIQSGKRLEGTLEHGIAWGNR